VLQGVGLAISGALDEAKRVSRENGACIVMSIDGLVNSAQAMVVSVVPGLTANEDLMPFVLGTSADGKGTVSVIAHPFPEDPAKRQRFFENLFAGEVRKGATELAFGHMAWQAKVSDQEIEAASRGEPILSASSRPDRQEVVYLTCGSASGEFAHLTAPVHRKADGSVEIGEFSREAFNEGLIPQAMRAAFESRPNKPWWRTIFGR
jgi:hypothetical protein